MKHNVLQVLHARHVNSSSMRKRHHYQNQPNDGTNLLRPANYKDKYMLQIHVVAKSRRLVRVLLHGFNLNR